MSLPALEESLELRNRILTLYWNQLFQYRPAG